MLEHLHAPAAYPEINNATLAKRRVEAAAAGDAGRMSLWAGQGHRSAVLDRPAGEIVEWLASAPGSVDR